MVNQPSEDQVQAAVAALDTVRRAWLRRPGVTAVDVGFKITGEEITDVLALRVHVARKIAVERLAEDEVFNDAAAPREIGGFPVDVIEATYGPSAPPSPVALDQVAVETIDRRTRIRPILGGISVGNPRITAGTLGAVVFDRRTCRPMILSNFHVLAGDTTAAAGEPILQPGRLDGGQLPADRVATLSRFRIDSQMDAAVATIDSGVPHDREILGIGTVTGTADPMLGMDVVKSGRTTAITEGVVDGVSLTVSIDYGGSVGIVTLTDQVHIVPRPPWPAVDTEVSMGGDSGSVWLEQATRRAVGLHFAGETDPAPSAENAICTPINRVAAEFDISFLPVLCRPVFDLCRRFPALCRLIRRPPFELPVPFPPGPFPPGPFPPGPFPPGPFPPGPGPDPGPQGRQAAGCQGCGGPQQPGPSWDQQALAELAILLGELQAD